MDFPATAPHTGTLASLDLAIFTRKHALSNALQATAHRRALLQSRDDAQLGPLLGTTHADMIRSATHRRASETLSRHAEQLSALLLRPGSRMATLARVPGGAVSQLATARGVRTCVAAQSGACQQLLSLGAAEVIDHNVVSFCAAFGSRKGRILDAVLDCVGVEGTPEAIRTALGASYVSLASPSLQRLQEELELALELELGLWAPRLRGGGGCTS